MLEATAEANNRNAVALSLQNYKQTMDKVLGTSQFMKLQQLQVRRCYCLRIAFQIVSTNLEKLFVLCVALFPIHMFRRSMTRPAKHRWHFMMAWQQWGLNRPFLNTGVLRATKLIFWFFDIFCCYGNCFFFFF